MTRVHDIPSEAEVRRIAREEIASTWATEQFYRQLFGVGRPVHESMLQDYIKRTEFSHLLHSVVDPMIKNEVFREVNRVICNQTAIQTMFMHCENALSSNLRKTAEKLEQETTHRLNRISDQVVEEMLRTDDGHVVISTIEQRVAHGPLFYVGMGALAVVGGIVGGVVSAQVGSRLT